MKNVSALERRGGRKKLEKYSGEHEINLQVLKFYLR
jgi:hypothetical protein